tara:strand:- start:821 stop:1837 length:1017 start_codon:yes stop_codon:yes gene_type:complete
MGSKKQVFKAAVLIKKNTIKIFNLIKPKLKPHQAFVKIKYSSICHTQVQEIEGKRGVDKYLPHCLGHEAIGEIKEIHQTVKKFKVGDIVCLSWIKNDGKDSGSVIYSDINGLKINAGPVHTFNEYAVISENRIYKLKNKKNLKSKLLLGCAMSTAYNTLHSDLNSSSSKTIVIIGCGGLGLSCVVMAKLKKYSKIIAIDKVKKKLIIAKEFGATHTYSSLKKLKQKFDVIIECTGNIEILKSTFKFTKEFGGKIILIGNYPKGQKINLDPWHVIKGITMKGAWLDNDPFNKKFMKLEKLMENRNYNIFFGKKVYDLANINNALTDLKNGKTVRPLIAS